MAYLPHKSTAVTVMLVGLVCFGSMSIDLYLPSLPAMVKALGTDPSHAQMTIGVFSLGTGVAQMAHGPLSDRYGRRPVLLGGIAVYVLASLVCAVAGDITMLITARFFQAVGCCAAPVLGRAIVRDVYPLDQAAGVLSLLQAAFTLSPIAAPMIGGILEVEFGWHSPFVAMAVLSLVMLFSVWFLLGESNQHRDPLAVRPGRIVANYAMLLRHKEFRGHLALQGCIIGSMMTFLSGAPFVFANVLGGRPEFFGFFFLVPMLGYLSGALTTARLVRRVGSPRMLRIGCLVGVAGGLLGLAMALLHIETFAAVACPAMLIFFGNGMVSPNNVAEALAPFGRNAGAASAMLGFFQMIFGVIAGYLVVRMGTDTTLPLQGTMALLWVSAALIYFRPGGRAAKTV